MILAHGTVALTAVAVCPPSRGASAGARPPGGGAATHGPAAGTAVHGGPAPVQENGESYD